MVMQHDQVGFIPEMQWWCNICKSVYRTYNKNHIITQWMQEDVFKKSTWLHDKSVNECINQGNLLQYNKNCMQEIHSLSHPKWKKKLEKNPTEVRNRTVISTILPPFQHYTWRTSWKNKATKDNLNWFN